MFYFIILLYYHASIIKGWWTVIDNHLKNKNNLTNKIPAPEMADEIAKRSQMIKSVKEIQSIISEF